MADVLALEHLVDGVQARFVASTEPLPAFAFGWREPSHRDGEPLRIVWVPGDDSTGDLGEVSGAVQPGRAPRPLATLRELVTAYIEARDESSDVVAEDERAQYRACRLLFDRWLRAVYLVMHTRFRVESARWVNERSVRRAGATIRVLLSVEAMVPDADVTELEPTPGAAVETSALDVTEDMTIAAVP